MREMQLGAIVIDLEKLKHMALTEPDSFNLKSSGIVKLVNEIERLRGMLTVEREAHLATPAATSEQAKDAAMIRDAAPEYELHCDDEWAAGTSGPRAWDEIRHYAAQYSQDGPIRVYRVSRVEVTDKLEQGLHGKGNE